MNETVKDKYDAAIDWLVARPDKIRRTWYAPTYSDGGSLFLFCTPTGAKIISPDVRCGCLTQVHCGDEKACTELLTDAIRADDRIPRSISDICHLRGDALRAALQPFAEWQRRLDKEIRS